MNKKIINSSENRKDANLTKKKNFNLNQKKNNALKSLKEVENFLRNTNKLSKYIKLYKITKNNR